MIMMCLGSLVKGQSKDTIVITKTHYKTLLEIAAEEHACQLTLNSKIKLISDYRLTVKELQGNIFILEKSSKDCLDKNLALSKEVNKLEDKIKNKNKWLKISWGIIGGYVTYQGIRLYLILVP